MATNDCSFAVPADHSRTTEPPGRRAAIVVGLPRFSAPEKFHLKSREHRLRAPKAAIFSGVTIA